MSQYIAIQGRKTEYSFSIDLRKLLNSIIALPDFNPNSRDILIYLTFLNHMNMRIEIKDNDDKYDTLTVDSNQAFREGLFICNQTTGRFNRFNYTIWDDFYDFDAKRKQDRLSSKIHEIYFETHNIHLDYIDCISEEELTIRKDTGIPIKLYAPEIVPIYWRTK